VTAVERIESIDRDAAVRSRTITWTDPAAARHATAGRDGYERLLAMMHGETSPPPAVAAIGATLEDVERGQVIFSLRADELHENPMGTMHGGVIATLVDTAMGCAVSSTLNADEGFTTLELKTNYLRAITKDTGCVTAVGRVVHAGSKTALAEAHVYDADGTLCAHATSTCMIMRGMR
jgi:uncharacterized protein (TIGR00369 family)